MPPAFVLSQDQTLRKRSVISVPQGRYVPLRRTRTLPSAPECPSGPPGSRRHRSALAGKRWDPVARPVCRKAGRRHTLAVPSTVYLSKINRPLGPGLAYYQDGGSLQEAFRVLAQKTCRAATVSGFGLPNVLRWRRSRSYRTSKRRRTAPSTRHLWLAYSDALSVAAAAVLGSAEERRGAGQPTRSTRREDVWRRLRACLPVGCLK
jgi:hypothetical protein